ncbi:hypothetical protein UlMin_028972, partial [Ulmus minor]
IEVLYSKLYDKYSKLKNKKFNELDKLNRDQEEVFVNYASAAEEYVKYLQNENEMLHSQVDDLRIEVDSIRVSNDEKSTEYHKLWMEESKKNEVLHEEIERLQKLQENGTFSGPKKKCKRQLTTSGELFASSPGRITRSKRKRSSWIETEGAVTPNATGENEAIQRQLIKDAHKDTFYNGCPVNVHTIQEGAKFESCLLCYMMNHILIFCFLFSLSSSFLRSLRLSRNLNEVIIIAMILDRSMKKIIKNWENLMFLKSIPKYQYFLIFLQD